MKKWIFLGVGGVVLLGAAIGGTIFFIGGNSEASSADAPVSAAATEEKREVHYYYVQPEFVVNFRNKERPRALMIEISVASHDQKSLDVLDTHSPELRNNLLMLMSERTGTELSTAAGKTALRDSMKSTLNELLLKHTGEEAVEAIYFTRFVLQ